MPSNPDHAQTFRSLHRPGDPLVLFNIWDAGSAQAVAAAGAKAIATGSWAVASANGYPDGEQLPLDLALANLERIVSAVVLPVSFDIEGGYADTAEAVGRHVAQAIRAGAIGLNLEDSAGGSFRSVEEQVNRLAAAREAADATGVAAFINARTDVFFRLGADEADEVLFEEAVKRAAAYQAAGADGLFVPGLVSDDVIARLVQAVGLPVNVMTMDASPPRAVLAQLGVARISHGAGPYRAAMQFLEHQARISLT
jgi:2-methylisocitrate lyase-like PEP mutase family enzyme